MPFRKNVYFLSSHIVPTAADITGEIKINLANDLQDKGEVNGGLSRGNECLGCELSITVRFQVVPGVLDILTNTNYRMRIRGLEYPMSKDPHQSSMIKIQAGER